MIDESTPDGELAQDSGELESTGDAALDYLLNKDREQPAQDAQDAPAKADASDDVEGGDAPEEAAEEAEEDDPEYDLGDVKAKKSEILAWKAGEMKDADYRRKTAETAEAKRTVQAEREHIAQERSHYANHLDVILSRLQMQLIGDQDHLAELARNDQAEWVVQNAVTQQRYADYQAALQERTQLANRVTAEQERETSEWVKAERSALSEKLPEWSDPSVKQRESLEIAEYLISKGYPHEELSNLQDHRALLIARDAAKWQQHIKAKASAQAKQVKAEPPKAIRPGAAPTEKASQQNSRLDDLRNRAKRTNKQEDITAYLVAKQG